MQWCNNVFEIYEIFEIYLKYIWNVFEIYLKYLKYLKYKVFEIFFTERCLFRYCYFINIYIVYVDRVFGKLNLHFKIFISLHVIISLFVLYMFLRKFILYNAPLFSLKSAVLNKFIASFSSTVKFNRQY